MKDRTIVMALTYLLIATFCVRAHADGFKFSTISNPFKKPTASNSTEPTRRPRATGSNLSAANGRTVSETSSFSLPKLKLPKFKMPSFGGEQSRTSTTTRQPSSRTTVTRQSRSNYNRPPELSVFDKFSQGTKSFFGKAKTTLMPWTNDTASTTRRPIVPSGSWSQHSARTNGGTRSASRSNSQIREPSTSTGFTFPWSKPEREIEEDITSVPDFLALPRPQY